MSNKEMPGKCCLCGGTFEKTGMTKHLKSCLLDNSDKVFSTNSKGTGEEKYLHISIEGRYDPDYWIHVEMSASAQLRDLDEFLRLIWLECCGHLSAFTIEGTRYLVSPMEDFEERDMSAKLSEILRPGIEFFHEYDFGSTTKLMLKVVSERMIQGKSKKVRVLSRNYPPEIKCVSCGKPATRVCVECIYDEGGWLCEDCASSHECGEDMLLPVVNSPRTGVCGYSGEVD